MTTSRSDRLDRLVAELASRVTDLERSNEQLIATVHALAADLAALAKQRATP